MSGPDLAGVFRVASAAAAIAVAVLSLTPDAGSVERGLAFFERLATILFGDPSQADKLGHFSAHAGLAFLALAGFRRRRGAPVVIAALLAYGAALELAQSLLAERSVSPYDALANALGVLAGAAATSIFLLLPERQRP